MNNGFLVVLFDCVNSALTAEKILKKQGIAHKIIPVPRHISSDCGVCIRIQDSDRIEVEESLDGKMRVFEVREL